MRSLDIRRLLACAFVAAAVISFHTDSLSADTPQGTVGGMHTSLAVSSAEVTSNPAPRSTGQAMQRTSVAPLTVAPNSELRPALAERDFATNGTPTNVGKRVQQPLRLSPPSKRQRINSPPSTLPTTSRALSTVLGSLAIVLGLFLLVAWFARRTLPKVSADLPQGVVELLGRAPLGYRQYVQLVRIGKKLLLLSITPAGAETLTEITDAEEVDRIAGLCQQSQPGSISTTFRQVFAGLGNESADRGLLRRHLVTHGLDPSHESGPQRPPTLESVEA